METAKSKKNAGILVLEWDSQMRVLKGNLLHVRNSNLGQVPRVIPWPGFEGIWFQGPRVNLSGASWTSLLKLKTLQELA